MDPHLKFSDTDNRYSNPFGHSSTTLNKSPNPASYTLTHNIDSSTHHHTQPSHLSDSKVIISSALGSPYMDYSQQGVHRTTQSQSSGPKDSNFYVAAKEHGSRRYGSGLGSSSNIDLGGSNRKSSGRRISDEALDTLKSKTFGLGTKTSGYSDVAANYRMTSPENIPAGGQFLSSLPNVRSYGVGSNLKDMIYGADHHKSKDEQRQRLLSPEAERILHGHAVETYQSNLHGRNESRHQENIPYQSVLAEGSHLKQSYTPVDTTKSRGRQTATRVSHDMGSPPLTRDALEVEQGIKEYQITEPQVSKKTIYTIENSHTSSNKQITATEVRSHRTPEKTPRPIVSSHSPLDNLRHSIKNEGARISRIVIETVDNGNEEDLFYDLENVSGKKQVRQSNPHFEHFERSPYDEPKFQSHTHTVAEQPIVREHRHDEPKLQSHTHTVTEQPVVREHRYDEPKFQSHIHTVPEQPIVREHRYDEPKFQSHTHTHTVTEHPVAREYRHDEPKFHSQTPTVSDQHIPQSRSQIKSPYQSPPMSSRQHSSRGDLHAKDVKKAYDLKKEMEELRHEIIDYTRSSQQLENLPELRHREKGRYEPHSGSALEYNESEHHYQDYEPEHEHEHHHHHHHHEHEHHREHHHEHHHEQEHEHEQSHHHHHHHEPKKETHHEKHVHNEPKIEHVEHVHHKKIEEPVKETVVVCKEKKSRHIIVKGVIGLLVILLASILWMELCTDIDLDEYYPAVSI